MILFHSTALLVHACYLTSSQRVDGRTQGFTWDLLSSDCRTSVYSCGNQWELCWGHIPWPGLTCLRLHQGCLLLTDGSDHGANRSQHYWYLGKPKPA